MKNKFLLIAFLIFSFSFASKADSPLTSTDLAVAYSNEAIIDVALFSLGEFNDELLNYLNDKSNPIDVKLAVINKLGWDINGKNNAEIFWEYLKKNNNFKSLEEFKKKGSSDLLICYAYLKALDNYNDVAEALKIAKIALKKEKKKRYSVYIVAAIIEAQSNFDSNWCELWKCTDRVRSNKKLKIDLRLASIENIFEYMDLYEVECK